jgi:hypothetical protein
MSQFHWGVIPANVTSGTALAALMEQTGQALLSNHMGNSRPPYAVDGLLWVNNADPTNAKINVFYDGVDVEIGRMKDGVFSTSAWAASMLYDNTLSAMAAINVQDALDDLAARVVVLENS